MPDIAWGAKVSAKFKSKVIAIANELGCDPSHLMASMAFETGETFSPSIRNKVSGATGLIQFMSQTAIGLGTTQDALAAMTAEDQLDFVRKYFLPQKGKLHGISDVYMAILSPNAVGKPEAFVLFKAPSKPYEQNKGLDVNKDGQITKGEAAGKVYDKLQKGLAVSLRG